MYMIPDHEYEKLIHALVVPENLSVEEKDKRYQPLMDFLKANTPDKLYRFRSCKERTIKEFDQDIFGFSPAAEMNDDFDGMLYFDKESIRATLVETLTPQMIKKTFESVSHGAIPAEIKNCIPAEPLQRIIKPLPSLSLNEISLLIKQFTNFVTKDYDNRMTFLSQLTQNQKIACLSPSIESAAMWGYYANDGTGFALSYDLRELSFSEYCLVPVIYGDERFDATEYATWLLQQQTLQRIWTNDYMLNPLLHHTIPCPDEFMCTKVLIHKASNWSHEKEWRLVFYEKMGQSEKYPHISKRPTAIYMGRNISAIHEKILRHIAVEKNIPAFKMMICENNPTYSLYPQIL